MRVKSTSMRLDLIPDSMLSVMAEVSRKHHAINLSSGFPDFPAPAELKEAACRSIMRDINQYSTSQGSMRLREMITEKYKYVNNIDYDPEREVTVTCGSAEALSAAVFSIADPGDEAIIIEPAFESYLPAALLAGCTPRYLTLRPPEWRLDPDSLSRLFNAKTKLVIFNTPHNPTGKVFTRRELEHLAELCQRWDSWILSDEIYEHLTYDGAVHVSPASIPALRERTVTISGFSKTYSVTGWRLGYCCAPASLTDKIRRVHSYLTVCAPSPFQEAALTALSLPDEFYDALRADYTRRRSILLEALRECGMAAFVPEGTYFCMADFSALSRLGAEEFCHHMAREIGVTAAPGSYFHPGTGEGSTVVRFAFCKREDTLQEAARRLRKLRCGSQNI